MGWLGSGYPVRWCGCTYTGAGRLCRYLAGGVGCGFAAAVRAAVRAVAAVGAVERRDVGVGRGGSGAASRWNAAEFPRPAL